MVGKRPPAKAPSGSRAAGACAAFIAQQQGIEVSTAFEKVPDQILNVWLVVAEFAREAWKQNEAEHRPAVRASDGR
jgi:hypothetical protein